MRRDPESTGENPPDLAQTSRDDGSCNDSDNSTQPCVHNGRDKADSLIDSNEVVEEFLRRTIDVAQAEVVESQVSRKSAGAAPTIDAAVISFVTTYAAAHASPQKFLRNLTNALRDLEAVPPTQE